LLSDYSTVRIPSEALNRSVDFDTSMGTRNGTDSGHRR
jgi:hypothetical protein